MKFVSFPFNFLQKLRISDSVKLETEINKQSIRPFVTFWSK
jgi:hypothetical protein